MRRRINEFALEINKPGDLTEPLRTVYIEMLEDGPCRLAIYAPELTSLPNRHEQPSAAYLLMIFDERISVAVDPGTGDVSIARFPLDDVLCVEMGQVLLFCWIKIVFGRNVCRQIKVPFNLVRFALFRTALNLIRQSLDNNREGEKVKPLESLPLESLDLDLKFQNVVHDIMVPDELLLKIAFQPEVRTRRFLFLQRQVMPPLLAAITNRQFFLVTEEPPASVERLGRFSEIYTYCPHERIDSLIAESNDNEKFPQLVLTLTNESARFVIRQVVSREELPIFRELCDHESAFLDRKNESVLI